MNQNSCFSSAIHPEEEKLLLMLEAAHLQWLKVCRRTYSGGVHHTHGPRFMDKLAECSYDVLARVGNRSRLFSQE